MGYRGVVAGAMAGVLATAWMPASAEALDLSCTNADGSESYRLTVDLSSGLVSNGASRSGRRWAAVVNDKDITWDEVFDTRGGHTANRYLLDRASGTFRGTDLSRQEREILSLTCRKAL